MRDEFFVPGNGWLHRLDPRVKMLGSLVLVVLSCLWGNVLFLAAIVALEFICFMTDGIDNRTLKPLVKPLFAWMVAIFIVLLLCLKYGEHQLWQWGWWRVTAEGLNMSGVVALRVGAIVLALFLTLFTVSNTQWVYTFRKLGWSYPQALHMAKGIQFLPLYWKMVHDTVLCQEVRGLSCGKERKLNLFSKFTRWYTAHMDASAVVKATMRRATSNQAMALCLQGFGMRGGKVKQTALHPVKMRVLDWLALLLILVLTAACVWLMVACHAFPW